MGSKETLSRYLPKANSSSSTLSKYLPKKESLYSRATTPFFKKFMDLPSKKPIAIPDKTAYRGFRTKYVDAPIKNRQMGAALQGFLPVMPETVFKREWEQEHPVWNLGGKIAGYAALGKFTAGIAPSISQALHLPGGVGALAKYAPLSKLHKLGVGMWLQTSKAAPFLARAIPRAVSRAALWGGKRTLDETMRVVAGDDPSFQKLVKEPTKDVVYGGLSGLASGVGKTAVRIAAQGGMRGLWTTGQALLADGVLDKNDLINISTNAVLGAAVEAINAKQTTRAYQSVKYEAWENNWMRTKVMRMHPEYTPKEVDNAIGIMKAWGQGYKVKFAKPVIESQMKKLPDHLKANPTIKAAVVAKIANATADGATVKQAFDVVKATSTADLIKELRVDGISSNILRPFEVPETDPEQVTRPSIPLETVVISPTVDNYTVTGQVIEDKLTGNVGEEKVLEYKAQSAFDAMGIRYGKKHLTWSQLPQIRRRVIARYVQENGEEGLGEVINEVLNQNVIVGVGGVTDSPESPVFFGRRAQWGRDPSTNIESVVTDMLQKDTDISPSEMLVQSSNPGDGMKLGELLKDEYMKKAHPKEPEAKAEVIEEPIVQPEAPLQCPLLPPQEPADLKEFFKDRKKTKAVEKDIDALQNIRSTPSSQIGDWQKKEATKLIKRLRKKGYKVPNSVIVKVFDVRDFVETKKRTPRYGWSPKSGEGFWERQPELPKLSPEEEAPISPEEQARREQIAHQQKVEVITIKLQNIIDAHASSEQVPTYLGNTETNDMSKRERKTLEETEETEGKEEGEVRPEQTAEQVAEQDRFQQGRKEQAEIGRDIADYLTEAQDQLNGLKDRLEGLKNSLAPKEQIIVVQRQINDVEQWLNGIAVDNDLYSIINGVLKLKQGFVNLQKGVWVGDVITGKQVHFSGYGEALENGQVSPGALRLVDIGDGKVHISDTESATVFPAELLNIWKQGGEFTNEANIAAGGVSKPADNKVKAFDGKGLEDSTSSLPGMREPVLRLKVIFKTMGLFGWDQDKVLEQLGNWGQEMIRAIQDPKVAPTIVQEMEREVHLNKYAYLIGKKLENDIRQYLRERVVKARNQNKLPIDEQSVVEEIDSWLFVMAHANAEVGAVDALHYFLTDQGLQRGFQPGKIPGQPDSEQLAAIDAYMQATGKVRMPSTLYGVVKPIPGKFSSLNLPHDPAKVQMMKQGTRPELLFFNMLPGEFQRLLLYVKAEFENVHFKDQIDSGIMDRADLNALVARGYSPRSYKFANVQQRDGYYQAFLGSTDLPHAKYETYAEFVLAAGQGKLGAGLMPVVDYAASLGDYAADAIRRTAQMNMIKSLKGISNEFLPSVGLPPLGLITYEEDAKAYLKTTDLKRVTNFLTDNNYSKLKLPGLVEYFHGGFTTAWVRNDLHDMIKQMYASNRSPVWIKVLVKLNGVAKRNIMLAPYQYLLQIGSSPAAWMMWGKGVWSYYIKPIVTFEAAWAPSLKRWKAMLKSAKDGYGFRYGLNQHLSEWDHIIEEKIYDPKMLDALMREGLSVLDPATIKESMYGHDTLRSHPDHRTAWQDFWEFLAGKAGVDTQIFNHIGAKFMYQYTVIIHDRLVKEGVDSKQAMKLAVDFSNRTSGLLDPAKWKGSDAAMMYRLFMFARDFCFSFMTQVTGATYKIPIFPTKAANFVKTSTGWEPPKWIGWKPLHKYKDGDFWGLNVLFHSDKTSDEMNVMTRYFRTHLMKVLMAKMVYVSLLQYAIIAAYLATPEGQQDDTITEEDQWAWTNWNDPKRFGMIKTPWRDHMGRQIYIDPMLFREFNQIASIVPFIGGNIGAWAKGKISSWFVNMSDIVRRQIDWKNQPITDSTGQISFLRRQKDLLPEYFKTVKPTFVEEEPIASPALKIPSWVFTILGHPLRRSRVAVGKGESFEENKAILEAVGQKRYSDMQRKKVARKPMSQGDIETLERLVDLYEDTDGKEGISRDALNNYLDRQEEPGYTMERKNKKAIELFMKGR